VNEDPDIKTLRDMCGTFESLHKRLEALQHALLDISTYTPGDATTLRRLAKLALDQDAKAT